MADIIVAIIGGIIVVAGIVWGVIWETKPSCKEKKRKKKLNNTKEVIFYEKNKNCLYHRPCK